VLKDEKIIGGLARRCPEVDSAKKGLTEEWVTEELTASLQSTEKRNLGCIIEINLSCLRKIQEGCGEDINRCHWFPRAVRGVG